MTSTSLTSAHSFLFGAGEPRFIVPARIAIGSRVEPRLVVM